MRVREILILIKKSNDRTTDLQYIESSNKFARLSVMYVFRRKL